MKRAANYKKLALVERGELERLRQKQLKDYNPILSQLAAIQQEIERVLGTNQLSVHDRLGVLTLLHSRFDNLYKTLKYNGVLAIPAGAPLPIIQPAPAAFPPAFPAAPIFAGEQAAPAFANAQGAPLGIAAHLEREADLLEPIPDREGEHDAHEMPRAEGFGGVDVPAPGEQPEFRDIVRPAATYESRSMQTTAPVRFPEIKNLKLGPKFQNKYDNLIEKLSPYPHIINSTAAGELVLHGKTIPTSNFNDLLTSLFQQKENLNLEGEDEFLDVLRHLKITEDHLSSKHAKSKLTHSLSSA